MARLYSVREANELLPHLAPTLVELRDKYERAARVRVEVARASATNGGSSRREEWSRLLSRVNELIERIQQWELELRDVSTGLVDFPAIIEGQEAWLCWRLGEPAVAHWHPRTEGFSSRRPLGDADAG